jgi:hypothetical protein
MDVTFPSLNGYGGDEEERKSTSFQLGNGPITWNSR